MWRNSIIQILLKGLISLLSDACLLRTLRVCVCVRATHFICNQYVLVLWLGVCKVCQKVQVSSQMRYFGLHYNVDNSRKKDIPR